MVSWNLFTRDVKLCIDCINSCRVNPMTVSCIHFDVRIECQCSCLFVNIKVYRENIERNKLFNFTFLLVCKTCTKIIWIPVNNVCIFYINISKGF